MRDRCVGVNDLALAATDRGKVNVSPTPVKRTVRWYELELMPEKLFGIPAHPLMVHLPVVLLPLCALIALVLAVRPSLVRHFGIPFVVLTGVSFIGTFLATESGEGLQELLNEKAAAIERHAEWGDRTRIAALVFFLLAIAFVVLVKRSQRVGVTTSPSTSTATPPRSPLW